jgi:hypothetical protein
MQPKQKAFALLLGVGLACGVVGFSAAGYMGHEKFASQYGPRAKFYDELGLSGVQRTTLDSLAFQQDCTMRALLAPQKQSLDLIRNRFRAQQDSVFTPAQRAKLDERRKELKARRDAEQAKEPKRTCAGN